MISLDIHIDFWRNKNMYKTMKKLIAKHFYKTAEAAQQKIDVFYAANRLTDDQYTELCEDIVTIYGEDEA